MAHRLEWHGPQVEAAVHNSAADGLADALEHLLGASRAVVPIETSFLENTGTTSIDRGALRGVISYDGPYAVIQHEAMEFVHDPGRTAKYLERPAHEQTEALKALIAAAIRRATT